MLYGWIEVGASNDNIFSQEVSQDIILRTIYNNKIIMGNTNGVRATAALYIQDNNVGVQKVPEAGVALDVNGKAVIKELQVGISNNPTSLVVNGDIIIKDQSKAFASNMQMMITNDNDETVVKYNDIQRIKVTNGNGLEINDNLLVTNDVFATAFQITSDERFKTNITNTETAKDVATIKQIQVRDYEMKSCPLKVVKGFIAQELETVFPQAIIPKRGLDDHGVMLHDIKTIDTNQVLAMNTSVIQCLLARVEELEKIVYGDNKPIR